jgi:polar amino acid transport system permease protein
MWSWEFAWSILPHLLTGLWVTCQAVFLGMLLALLVGLLFALCRRSRSRLVSWPAGAVVEFIRSTPLLVQVYFLYFFLLPEAGLDVGPLAAGVIALGLHYGTYISEVYRAGIEGVPKGQWEACRALDLTRWQTYRLVVLPQAVPAVLPALGNYLIAMFKDTPLLSAITVVEVLRQAQIIGAEKFRYVEPFTLVGIMYLVLSLLAGHLVTRLEDRFLPERNQIHA